MKQQAQAATKRFTTAAVRLSPTLAGAFGRRPIPACAPQAAESGGGKESVAPTVAIDPLELEQHRVKLTQFATRLLRNRTAAEDAVQETFLAALQTRHQFSGRSSVKTWLFGILKHKITDSFRLSSRERPMDIDHDIALLEDPAALFTQAGEWRKPPSLWAEPEEALNQRQFLEVLEQCLDSLPKSAAQVFSMREILGMDTREICKAVGITENNCHVILHRARATLRTLLESSWFRDDADTAPNRRRPTESLQFCIG